MLIQDISCWIEFHTSISLFQTKNDILLPLFIHIKNNYIIITNNITQMYDIFVLFQAINNCSKTDIKQHACD